MINSSVHFGVKTITYQYSTLPNEKYDAATSIAYRDYMYEWSKSPKTPFVGIEIHPYRQDKKKNTFTTLITQQDRVPTIFKKLFTKWFPPTDTENKVATRLQEAFRNFGAKIL